MGIKTILKKCVKGIFSIIPKNENKIIFESCSDFCDNSRALFEHMIKNNYNEKYEFIWCVDNPKSFENYNVKNVKFTSFRQKKYLFGYLKNIATAKTVIYTHATPPFINTKKQTVACLWHGTPLKQMHYQETGEKPFSFLCSASEWCNNALISCFPITNDDLKITGYPRNDLLFQKNDALKKLNIQLLPEQKLLLWMPTFRKSSKFDISDGKVTQTNLPLVETVQQLNLLNEHLKSENILMVIKLHPLQDLSGENQANYSNIVMLTNDILEQKDIQLYHLVNNADVLLTDYSSIYFDFLLLNRPIGFIIDDIDIYRQNRGFVVENPLELMPGVHIKSIAELNAFLKNIKGNVDFYGEDRQNVLKIMNTYVDDKSCERLLKILNINI